MEIVSNLFWYKNTTDNIKSFSVMISVRVFIEHTSYMSSYYSNAFTIIDTPPLFLRILLSERFNIIFLDFSTNFLRLFRTRKSHWPLFVICRMYNAFVMCTRSRMCVCVCVVYAKDCDKLSERVLTFTANVMQNLTSFFAVLNVRCFELTFF